LTCARCPESARPCAGPCPCKLSGKDVTTHKRLAYCPLGHFGSTVKPDGWDALPDAPMPSPPAPPKPIAEWPMTARIIAKLRSPEDGGIGDTIHRHLSRFGADAMTRLYTRIVGTTCGCSDRQERLNQLFRYAPG